MKRIALILLASLLLLGACIPAGAAESREITLSKTSVTMNAGASLTLKATTTPSGAKVTWKSNNTSVVSVDKNGKLTAKADGRAAVTATAADGKSATCAVTVLLRPQLLGTQAVKYSSAYFRSDSSTYLPEIALTSIALSGAAGSAKDINAALVSLGFDQKSLYNLNYSKDYTTVSHRVGATFATRKMALGAKENNLIVIVLRGTNKGEWISNFDVTDPSIAKNGPWAAEHYGFHTAAAEVLKSFEDYCAKNGLNAASSTNKIWITGHSRGGAVANIVASELTASGKAAKAANIYGYTFATPTVAENVKNQNNIINFVFAEDFFTNVPPTGWSFARHGRDVTFQRSYSSLYSAMKSNYKKLTGETFAAYSNAKETEQAIATMMELAPTLKDYYKKQNALTNDLVFTLSDYFKALASVLANIDDPTSVSKLLPYMTTTNPALLKFNAYLIKDRGVQPAFVAAHQVETYAAWVMAYNSAK